MPKKFPLTFQETDKGIVVSGKTFDYKERIKELGGRWNAEEKIWLIPLGTDLSPLYLPLPLPLPLPPPVLPQPSWVCCNKAKIISYDKKQHICDIHGNPHQSNFFVRGCLYTGD